jgi:GT2 family glycosyltransferase
MTRRPTLAASVIVPSRNRPRLLADCVRSILAGDERPREIVVVDQSVDQNREVGGLGAIDGCEVRYHHVSSAGTSAARNEGIAIAREDLLVFTDDDMLVDRTWLGSFVAACREDVSSGILLTGRILETGRVEGTFAPSLEEDPNPRTYAGRLWRDILSSNNMVVSRPVFERIGTFDTRLGPGTPYHSAEDNDLCFRALEARYLIRYIPEAVAYHRAWRPTRDYRLLQWAYGVGEGAYLAKHVHLRDRHMARRLGKEVLAQVRVALTAEERDARRADAVLGLGLVYGSARWTIAERLLPALRSLRTGRAGR